MTTNKYDNQWDDTKTTNSVYYSKQMPQKGDNNKKFRYAELIMDSKLTVSGCKEKSKSILKVTEGGRQKVTATLFQFGDEDPYLPVIHISRRNKNDEQINHKNDACLVADEIENLYKFLSKVCSFKDPKKIVLDGEDFNKLPDNLRVGSYLSLGEKNIRDVLGNHSNKDLLEHLATREDLKPNDIIHLIEAIDKKNLDLADIALALELKNKTKSLKEFECRVSNKELLEDKRTDNWQDWFSGNKWFFGSDYIKILKRRTIDENSKTDFLASSYGNFLDVVEIKRPSLDDGKLFKEDIIEKEGTEWKYYHPTTDLTKAISQCLRYINEIEKKVGDPDGNKKFEECDIVKPRCTLIFGRSNNFTKDEYKALRILNSHYNNFSIITYDQLLERAKRTLEITKNEQKYD